MESLTIVKIGGKIINDQKLLFFFLDSFQEIEGPKILVHGGGNVASQLSKKLGLKVNMHNGRRITDEKTLKIAVMTYAGLVNKKIVAMLHSLDCMAIGLSGADANIIQSHKRKVEDIDYGFVGDVDQVKAGLIKQFIDLNIVPVFCPITHDNQGQLFNTNADTIASKVAQAMSAFYNVNLKYCFEYNGVLENLDDPNSILKKVTRADADRYISAGVFADGMIPKIENAFDALENGARTVHICGINHVHEDEPGTQFIL